jgi:hypothetical protein
MVLAKQSMKVVTILHEHQNDSKILKTSRSRHTTSQNQNPEFDPLGGEEIDK